MTTQQEQPSRLGGSTGVHHHRLDFRLPTTNTATSPPQWQDSSGLPHEEQQPPQPQLPVWQHHYHYHNQQNQNQQQQQLQYLHQKPLPPPPPPSHSPPPPPPSLSAPQTRQYRQPVPSPNRPRSPLRQRTFPNQASNAQTLPPARHLHHRQTSGSSLSNRGRPPPSNPGPCAVELWNRGVPSPHQQQQYNPSTPSPRMTEFEFFDGSQLAESSDSDSDFVPKQAPQPRGHVRSMSHPFPSLFSSNKKKKRSPAPRAYFDSRSSSEDSRDGSGLMPTASKGGAAPRISPQKQSLSGGASKDLTTGSCMTCGSLVRWPRDLNVFKCTICLTINDLKPLTPGETGTGRSRDEGGPLSHYSQPVSLEHTKLLIRQCLRNFVASALAPHANIKPNTQASLPMTIPQNGPGRPHASTFDNENQEPSLFTPELVESPFLEAPGSFPNPSLLPPRSYSTSYSDQRPRMEGLFRQQDRQGSNGTGHELDPKKMFKPLEDYLFTCFTSYRCLQFSFGGPRGLNSQARHMDDTPRRRTPERAQDRQPESRHVRSHSRSHSKVSAAAEEPIAELDAKLLLLGDFAENGSWWTGGQDEVPRRGSSAGIRPDGIPTAPMPATKSPGLDWSEMEEWYNTVINAAQPWKAVYDGMVAGGQLSPAPEADLRRLETQILAGQDHAQRTLLKATETLLKRPGRPLTDPTDLRFLLLILSNPLLAARCRKFTGHYGHSCEKERGDGGSSWSDVPRGTGPASGQHSGIIKRILGLMSNSSNDCHNQLVAWLARFPESRFTDFKDFVSGFMAYRLNRQNEKKHDVKFDVTDGLIPIVSAGRSAATLHAALGPSSGSAKKQKEKPKKTIVYDDWQVKAAARVMTLIFSANNTHYSRRNPQDQGFSHLNADSMRAKGRVHARGQLLPTSDFYMALLDNSELTQDFEAWETKRAKFSFCQYPFLLSVWAKIQILEHDAKREMDKKARDAFFNSIMSRRSFDQYLYLNVRRDCLVEDSLKAVSEVIGSGGEDIKKGLRITFRGEEGVDAGGLRKEWFLLLVREVFNPDHGLFVYDDDSHYCYFNPNSFETSDQYFLVGVVFGLAIYNSTILDVAFPPFLFRKLLAASPQPSGASPAHSRPPMTYTLEDLAEFHPMLAKGLRQLLEFEGDVEETFCLDFVVDVPKYGAIERVPLCQGGERRAVTNANRREYVDLHVRYILDTAVARQFDPFKRGFFTVCGGNALSLFRPEEIELLVRGSEETLDVVSLKSAAEYDGWMRNNKKRPEESSPSGGDGTEVAEEVPTLRWFWDSFQRASPEDQRKLLIFITGSDRIPAMGAASLSIKILCLGDDCDRYPTARTCFNTLALWRYESKEKLERMLWGAVFESEGFGLK
ncbi:ubiquitin-protein ligase E3A [Pyricularia oryzae 70-15]|uniref:HECT-type E3 ubiquitin transferase n=3 Tax=Pyricularia oryzae TaxID=318829 RepID=G4NC86_PYRO7|nr:ubiquitin-protein ligase E3A [Pyricularia oryzae 70-15]EHA48235.1 ubiquitin-protein ligase E3A [Pyricularia oryzae 70-15]ELQ35621.1 ubiquitin-protein ligase E3A [Pyricularia oryzae Y34]KAI7922104.1 ubiquitin-protein ligase E3A [Pyricularia oryzae]KAI7926459.1 ubiquitin-protein ligase E3A [Pyricularia oryzae]